MQGGAALFLLFFGTAWINWGGRQAVLWDITHRQFSIFGATFWPQDFMLLSALLMIAAFGLFCLTVFAGRVWCGYSCPQSVWTWIFMWAEKVTEGDRNQRIKLDNSPFGANKALRRIYKHLLWLSISLVTAITFVGYFTPIRELFMGLLNLEVGGWAAFWIFFFTAATYINAGWLREQVCFHMCPYGRFQSSMLDANSLVITYDAARGENRGPRKKNAEYQSAGLGDCIDCKMCVQVCPTGIDIRDGLQMQCIGCAACIDACDSIMDKMGYAPGLIRYTSDNALNGGNTRILRPRLVGYTAVLITLIGIFSWTVATRPLLSVDVARDRTLFRFNQENEVENNYVLSVLNKSRESRTYSISVVGLEGLNIRVDDKVNVAPESMLSVPVAVSVSPEMLSERNYDIVFQVYDPEHPEDQSFVESRFIGPSVPVW